jgi:hypothetical protein
MLANVDSAISIWLWSMVLLVLVIVAFALVAWARRRMLADKGSSASGFTLGELRRLHREGTLTDQEYERAKAGLLAAAKSAAKTDPPGND